MKKVSIFFHFYKIHMYTVKLGKEVSKSVYKYFESKENWKIIKEEEDNLNTSYHLYWADHTYTKEIELLSYNNPNPLVYINHFNRLGVNQITNKAYLAKNYKLMKLLYKNLKYNFLPSCYILPKEYNKFMNNKRKGLWIIKPINGNRGDGIYLIKDKNEIDQVKDHAIIIQYYIHSPLLIANYKFDFRVYVLVTSFWPLKIYLHQRYMIRFSTHKYNKQNINDLYSHLTNSSINRYNINEYTNDKDTIGKGSKWTNKKLWNYWHNNHQYKEINLWNDMKYIIILTLLLCLGRIPSNKHAFELFGFDMLLDSKYKLWLLEVNRSPAMRVSCETDQYIKPKILDDLLNLLGYQSNNIDKNEFIQIFPQPSSSKNDDIFQQIKFTPDENNQRKFKQDLIRKYLKKLKNINILFLIIYLFIYFNL